MTRFHRSAAVVALALTVATTPTLEIDAPLKVPANSTLVFVVDVLGVG